MSYARLLVVGLTLLFIWCWCMTSAYLGLKDRVRALEKLTRGESDDVELPRL